MEEVTRGWRRLRSDKLHSSYYLSFFFFNSVLCIGPCAPRPSILWVSESVYTRRPSVGLPGQGIGLSQGFYQSRATHTEQDRQCMNNVIFLRRRVTIVAVETKQRVSFIFVIDIHLAVNN